MDFWPEFIRRTKEKGITLSPDAIRSLGFLFRENPDLGQHLLDSEGWMRENPIELIGKRFKKEEINLQVLSTYIESNSGCFWFLDPVTMRPLGESVDKYRWMALSVNYTIWNPLIQCFPTLVPIFLSGPLTDTVGLRIGKTKDACDFIKILQDKGFDHNHHLCTSFDGDLYFYFKHPGTDFGYLRNLDDSMPLVMDGRTFEGVNILANGSWLPQPYAVQFLPPDPEGKDPFGYNMFALLPGEKGVLKKKTDLPLCLLKHFVYAGDEKIKAVVLQC